MTDAPITHRAKGILDSLTLDAEARQCKYIVLGMMREMERELNAARVKLERIKTMGCDKCLQNYCCEEK